MLIDTHCHVDRFPDPLALARDCERQRIATVAVTQLPSHYQIAMRHLGKMQFVRPALGFHPLAVSGNESELPLFLSLLPSTSFVGEIGLDFSRQGISSQSVQTRVFRAIAKDMSLNRKFVTLHSRGAEEEVTDILSEFGVIKCVYHWFTGGLKAIKNVISNGHLVSINTAMTSTQKGKDLLALVPHDRILTETDGPYIKISGRVAMPSAVRGVLSGIAEVWGKSSDDVELQITKNFEDLCAWANIPVFNLL